jgi:RNA recognition motif-containing protein
MWVCFLIFDMSDDFRIVEYSTRGEAQNAIQTLSNTTFMNRQIFVREV